jgi:hypothetical protein
MAKKASKTGSDHPKTEKAKVETPRERIRSGPDTDFVLVLKRDGYHAEVASEPIEPVSLGNPTVMGKVIQDMRDRLETMF